MAQSSVRQFHRNILYIPSISLRNPFFCLPATRPPVARCVGRKLAGSGRIRVGFGLGFTSVLAAVVCYRWTTLQFSLLLETLTKSWSWTTDTGQFFYEPEDRERNSTYSGTAMLLATLKLQVGATGSTECRSCRGCTLLDAAVVDGNADVMSALISAGAWPDVGVWCLHSPREVGALHGGSDCCSRRT